MKNAKSVSRATVGKSARTKRQKKKKSTASRGRSRGVKSLNYATAKASKTIDGRSSRITKQGPEHRHDLTLAQVMGAQLHQAIFHDAIEDIQHGYIALFRGRLYRSLASDRITW